MFSIISHFPVLYNHLILHDEFNIHEFQDDDGDTDDVGEVFQDETNMAALLLYKQRLSDDYLMVSKHDCASEIVKWMLK